jgi:murein DD-endopeptidase MepM/ murein hydrolase activator NlpD
LEKTPDNLIHKALDELPGAGRDLTPTILTVYGLDPAVRKVAEPWDPAEPLDDFPAHWQPAIEAAAVQLGDRDAAEDAARSTAVDSLAKVAAGTLAPEHLDHDWHANFTAQTGLDAADTAAEQPQLLQRSVSLAPPDMTGPRSDVMAGPSSFYGPVNQPKKTAAPSTVYGPVNQPNTTAGSSPARGGTQRPAEPPHSSPLAQQTPTPKSKPDYPKRADIPSSGLPVTGDISSKFGPRRAPTAGASSNHAGVDIRAKIGTPVPAIYDGTIILRRPVSGGGNTVYIDCGKDRQGRSRLVIYHHLSSYSPHFQLNSHVTRGDVVAKVGNTGVSTGPHLHYTIKIDGKAVDPSTYHWDQ